LTEQQNLNNSGTPTTPFLQKRKEIVKRAFPCFLSQGCFRCTQDAAPRTLRRRNLKAHQNDAQDFLGKVALEFIRNCFGK
jgi:hypothetical protein